MSGNASISDENFTVVDYAFGKFTVTKFMGLGLKKRESPVYEAKLDL